MSSVPRIETEVKMMGKRLSKSKKQRTKNGKFEKKIRKFIIAVLAGVISGLVVYYLTKDPNVASEKTLAEMYSYIRESWQSNWHYNDLPIADINNSNTYYYQGMTAYYEGDYKTARDRFEAAVIDQKNSGKLGEINTARYYYASGNAAFYNRPHTRRGHVLLILRTPS